jgi:drug/metabolite transporter (DMT)-like permease
VIRVVFGFTLLGAGLAMLVLPGPGIVAIMVALAVLGAEFVWARRLLDRMKEAAKNTRDVVTKRRDDRPT